MIYEIGISNIEILEKTISKYIRKWLGLHQSLTKLALYSKHSPCPLPFKSLLTLFKTSKASSFLQLQYSSDANISGSNYEPSCGRSWSVRNAVADAECDMRTERIVGHTQYGKAGLGLLPSKSFKKQGTKEYRADTIDTLFDIEDKQNFALSLNHPLQLHWASWCDYTRYDLSWKSIAATPPALLRFHIGATFNTLPSPSNLIRWKMVTDPSCTLCSQMNCTIPHILSGCPFSLKAGRYNFRHDSVLLIFLQNIEAEIIEKKSKVVSSQTISFVKEGQSVNRSKRIHRGLLDIANDWVVLADIGNTRLIFPTCIAVTEDRPDIVIYSLSKRIVISIENTSGCEETFDAAHQYKKTNMMVCGSQPVEMVGPSITFQLRLVRGVIVLQQSHFA